MSPQKPEFERELTTPANATDFLIVGIGASAGGLEALEQLFEAMPTRTGMAFVVIQHLSPDFRSHMDELLGRRTRIAIRRVEDGMEVEPDTIYLLPPRKEMVIAGGRLRLTDKDPDQSLALPIDRFFRSLAHDARRRSVGIVLSGTGSDGSRGVTEIHRAGGLVIAQTEESARFDGMPLSAQETGVVDLILPPEAIPEALMRHVNGDNPGRRPGGVAAPTEPRGGMEQIIALLRSQYGIDFTCYKPSTVTRRTERRLSMVESADLESYAERLKNSPEELNLLYHDLLIGVTEFFRDHAAYQELEQQIIPQILESVADGDEVRIWVAGCATGEEAYSIAILFHEALERLGRNVEVRLFATDVHRASLEFASNAVYPEERLNSVSDGRRERFFVRRNDGFHVVSEIRKMIVFAPHNVVNDAPFTRLHLISCRNLLIYLQPLVQKRVLSLFHFALNQRGVLWLGPSETPADLADELETIHSHWKIYRKLRDVRLPADLRLPTKAGSASTRDHVRADLRVSTPRPQLTETYEALLSRYMPPGFLVDASFRLLHTFGGAERLLRIRGGTPPETILDMFDDGLRTPISGALHHAVKDRETVRYTGLTVPAAEGTRSFRLLVEPLRAARAADLQILVLLEEQQRSVAPAGDPTTERDARELSQDHIESLEGELQFTRENLQATIEELETSNEELQATNEELVASNEELQSTNEELHSVNEELYTVNAEHQRKISELTELTDDLNNLLDSTRIGVIFLDGDLCIRKFTSRVSEIFDLQRSDVGRPLSAFASTLNGNHLAEDAARVLETQTIVEREVRDRQGSCYFLRILPYYADRPRAGVVLTVINVDSLKLAEADVLRLSAIVESSDDAIIGKDLQGRITSWNVGAEKLYGFEADEVIGKDVSVIIPDGRRDEYHSLIDRIRAGEHVHSIQTVRRRKDRSRIEVSLRFSPIRNADGEIVGASGIARDITELQEARRSMQRAIRRRDRFLATLSHELRNPLSAVRSAAEVISRHVEDDDQRDRAANILTRQSGHMARLLDDLLDVSRITEGKIRVQKQLIDLRSTAADAVQSVQSHMEEREQQVISESCDEPLVVFADPVRLQQIQTNLLTNASKYSPRGESIHLRVSREGDTAVIEVQDNGMGVSDEIRDKIFEPFVQSPDALEQADGGMGIGLTLVRALVNQHSGKISVHSEGRGRGSRFTVRLPLRTDVKVVPRQPGSDSGSAADAPLRIVIVEDEDDNRAMLQTLLELDGHSVVSAENARKGIAAIVEQRPDVALVDLGLPDADGCEVARRIRSEATNDGIRLVALTGYGRSQDLERTRAAGFDAHVVKPMDPDKLARALRPDPVLSEAAPPRPGTASRGTADPLGPAKE